MSCYSPRFDEAMTLVLETFRPIRRKGSGVPYVAHLLSVTALVAEGGGDEDQLIAALLHDYLEDIEGSSADELERRFGTRVAGMVVALSDTTVRPKPPWRARKERYLVKLEREPPEVKLVSCADKLHNARTLVRDLRLDGPPVFDRFRGKRDGTLWYYTACTGALARGWRHHMLDQLQREVLLMHELSGPDHE